ncbi:MAG: TetR/AcrR family transcriptional regulator [Solirubrobacteraceae bacterium]|nr:TetR/AcrR family transcriptional regulator [Solirubrobacteraceae bacterium]
MPTQVQRTAAARRRLIAATRELVAAQGVGNTSVAAIGERAGMSRGAVNFHFGSKDDLLVAVSREATNDWAEGVAGSGELQFDDTGALIDTLLQAWLGELHSDPERVRIVVMLMFEALGPSPHLHEHFVTLGNQIQTQVGEYIRTQQAAGKLESDVTPDGFATLFVGVLTGIAVIHLLDPDTERLDQAIAEARTTLRGRLGV